MRASNRQQKIFSLLEERGTASVSELAEKFDVSENTIRNDLDALADQELIERTHGGAILPQFHLPPQLRPQGASHSPLISAITSYAVAWIESGDSLILGDSHLCVALAERMTYLKNLRVITTSMAVAYTLSQESTNSVVLAGGELDPVTLSTRGSMSETAIRNFKADKAFFSCTGVSAQNGLTDYSTENAAIRREMKLAANSVYILVESDRVGKNDLFSIGDLIEARRIITDDNLSHTQAQELADQGATRVTVCWESGHQTHRQRAAAGRTMRVGFANLSDNVWFSRSVREGVEKAAQDMVDLEVLIADNENKINKAIENAKFFLTQDIDLLIEYDGTGSASRPIRRLMLQAEVPVIAVDIPMMAATHFGSDHDAVGVSAGLKLLEWINSHWDGQVDTILLLNNEGGGTMLENGNLRIENWSEEEYLGALRPATRLHAALEILQDGLTTQPEVLLLALPGDWQSSEEAVATQQTMLEDVMAEIPVQNKVAAISLVPEDAIGFARAARKSQRCTNFVIITFGHDCQIVREELNRDNSCLMGIINLHPERYGDGLLHTAVNILRGEAVPPAVFVEHSFLGKS
jgi:DeoR family fructose operon transcriptional repressor